MMSPKRRPFSRAFFSALLLAVGTVLQNPRDPETWSIAAAIVAAAVSGGVRKNGE